MLHHHVVEVSMESTSVYWIPVWRVLSPYFKLNLADPYFIKQIPDRKSDVKDAQWIAECTMKELIRGSFVPPEIIQAAPVRPPYIRPQRGDSKKTVKT